MDTANQTQGFNIDNLDSFDVNAVTFNVDVILNGEGDGISGFTIVGKNSPEYQAEAEAIRVQGLQRSAKRRTAIDASTDEGAATLSTLLKTNETRLALSVVKDLYGFKVGGQPVPFSRDIVAKLFAKFPTWRDKVSAALEVEANFIKG